MGTGMELAYKHAVKKASGNVVSRVVVLTDGDANIGPNLSADGMLNSIQRYVKEGVTLSAIGFGMGNYRDDLMEKLADKGNGNCFYIDSYKEAKKVFEQQLTGTLEVIAKDVKIQVEFDPKKERYCSRNSFKARCVEACRPLWGEALRAEEPSLRSLVSRGRARLLPEDSPRAVDAELRSVVSVNTPEGLARHGATLPSPGLRGNARD